MDRRVGALNCPCDDDVDVMVVVVVVVVVVLSCRDLYII
jgi:hypothetical protein